MTRSRSNRSRRTTPVSAAGEPLTDGNHPQIHRTPSDDHYSVTKDVSREYRRGREKSISYSSESQESRERASKGYTPYMAARARELKEEGNRRFQSKDYPGAMEEYDLALKLTPMDHPERAVFHSNRAACLMHMSPIQYDLAIHECDLALRAHPGFTRALLRRSRAFEALGKLDSALRDVEELLRGDPNHPDALDIAKRIRASIIQQEDNGGDGNEERHHVQGRPSTPIAAENSIKQGTKSRNASQNVERLNDAKFEGSERSNDAKIRGLERSIDPKGRGSNQSNDAKVRGSNQSDDAKISGSNQSDDAKIRGSNQSDDAKVRGSNQSDDAKIRGSDQSDDAKIRGLDQLNGAQLRRSDQSNDAQLRRSDQSNDAQIRVSERSNDAKSRALERKTDVKIRGLDQSNDAKFRVSERSNDAKFMNFEKPNDAKNRISEEYNGANIGAFEQSKEQSDEAKIKLFEKSNHAKIMSLNHVSKQSNDRFANVADSMDSPIDSFSASSRSQIQEELCSTPSFGEEEDGTLFTPCASSRDVQNSRQEMATSIQESLSYSYSSSSSSMVKAESPKVESSEKVIQQDQAQISTEATSAQTMRPLKLIYDHDIRLAEMPRNSTFGELRKIVKETFPSAKAILIKYKDMEGDLVTITSTKELRLAELASTFSKKPQMTGFNSTTSEINSHVNGLPLMTSVLDQLRLHVVEVPADQEPYDKEEISLVNIKESVDKKEEVVEDEEKEEEEEEKKKWQNGNEEFDKWLVDFAHLFRTHLGVDPNGHVELHDRGMELVAEALEEMVTSEEEAHKLFMIAMDKFKDIIALGFLNWGNVYMCMARKQLPNCDGDDERMDFCERLQVSFDWAQKHYALAKEKFEQSLHVKPDFVDALLGLGQKEFESAKLHWSLAVASPADLRTWDSSEMLELFYSAEKRMERASDMLAKQEEQNKDAKTSSTMGKERQPMGDCYHEAVRLEQDVAMKSQIYLFWGNILYEHSQVEFRLQVPSWKQLLDAAVHKFELAGAPHSDIATALEKHLSNSSGFLDAEIQDHDTIINANNNVEVDYSDRSEGVDTCSPSEDAKVGSHEIELAVSDEEMRVIVENEEKNAMILENQNTSIALVSSDADMLERDEAKHPLLNKVEKLEELKQVDGKGPSYIAKLPNGGSDNQKRFENAGTKALIGEELIENEQLELSESSSNDVPSEAALHTGPHEMETTVDLSLQNHSLHDSLEQATCE